MRVKPWELGVLVVLSFVAVPFTLPYWKAWTGTFHGLGVVLGLMVVGIAYTIEISRRRKDRR